MNQSRFKLPLLPFLILLIAPAIAISQTDPRQQVEPSFEVSLQVIIGSNEAGQRGELPSGLSNISRQLRNNFSFTNYRLANTFLGRISNRGDLSYKSVSNVLGQESDAESQTFLEWTMAGFRNLPSASGQTGVHADAFRFGARVPIRTGSFKDEAGKLNPVVSYESVGLNLTRMGLRENVPTLIGTISLPRTTGTIFLVVTIKPAEV